ncbi:MAG: BatA domain-containing protein [Acidobacteria bacterium]|nr:BatA domain-containing protein [Acidobacteriota bacterium]
MSFLSPLFLVGALAAVVPLVLHLLRREPERRIRFAAVKLLEDAPVERTARKHLRELLLLALRMTALVLLALAFARPFFGAAGAAGGGAVIVALDRSYSMSAPGRFARAQAAAREAVEKAAASAPVGLVAFDDAAEVLAALSVDRAPAIGAIEKASAGAGGTRYRAALETASLLLGGRRGSIVLVTDLQGVGLSEGDRVSLPASTMLSVADLGPMPDNLAVVSVGSDGDRVRASIRNTAEAARSAHVRLTLDGEPAGDRAVPIAANASADVVFPVEAGAATASVAVDDPEGLQADNVRYIVLGEAARQRLLVVTATGDLDREAAYVKAALEASAPGVAAYELEGVGAAQIATWSPERLAPHAAVIVLSTRGLDRRGRDLLSRYTAAGGGLFVAAGPEVDGDVIEDVAGSASTLQLAAEMRRQAGARWMAPVDLRHPVLQRFAANPGVLGLARFRQVARAEGNACGVLARFTTGEAALLDCTSGAGRLLVWASDLDNAWNDFPLHATYVPFLHEAMRYLAASAAADEVLIGTPEAGGTPPGIVELPPAAGRPGASPRRLIAVNVDARESEPARVSEADLEAAITRLKDEPAPPAAMAAPEQEDRQHLWRYLLAAMVLVLAVEGIVAARTA